MNSVDAVVLAWLWWRCGGPRRSIPSLSSGSDVRIANDASATGACVRRSTSDHPLEWHAAVLRIAAFGSRPGGSDAVRRATVCIALGLGCGIAGCASRASKVGEPLNGPSPTVTYACQTVLSLRVRIESTSASVTVDGNGPYTLPQVSGRVDYTVYSDGTRTLEVYQGRVSFGIGRGVLQVCTR